MARIKLDNLLSLDINYLVRCGALEKGASMTGILLWLYDNGTERSSLRFSSRVDTVATGHIKLQYRCNEASYNEHIDIEATRQPFGGHRLWFRCPASYKRIATLYLIEGRFVSRHAHPTAYLSQSLCQISRAIKRKRKIGRKIEYDGFWTSRPKGMHHKTYKHLQGKLNEQEDLFDQRMTERFGDEYLKTL